MRKSTIAALSLAICAGSLVGCVAPRQANYRPPRADELRPGDIAPAPGPFVESRVPAGVQPVQATPYYYQPLPTPYQVPVYQMPVRPTVNCTTQRIGSQSYTNCY
jgi:hypothetical protein